jgi:rare lipoprotein A (peptidoglycan hydrolase)
MKLWATNGMAVAALVLLSGAISVRSPANELSQSAPLSADAPDVIAPGEVTPLDKAVVQLASAAEILAPDVIGPGEVTPLNKAVAQLAPAAEIRTPPPAKTVLLVPVIPQKPSDPAKAAKHHLPSLASDVRRPERHHVSDVGDPDRKIAQVKAIGPCQLGSAAWYGGRYVGRPTSSGMLLDQTHATAAHRTLPLNTLVRVTNLNNGLSVIVRITDRGPVSERLLIDVSPKAADELAMKTAGIVPVSIEQVVEVPPNSK